MNTRLLATLIALLVISLPICAASEMNLVWDANGNLISGDGKFRMYNGRNQLTHVFNGTNASAPLLETYKYHPAEERIWVKKVFNVSDSSHVLETVIYVNENSVRVINASGTFDFTYVLHAGGQIAQNVSGVTHFIHSDPGSAISKVITDIDGVSRENTSFDPQGSILEGGSNRFDMEDREYSSISGDYDFRFRKYDPDLGIFTQPDTVINNIFDPQQLNRYSFERSSPYNFVDPDGHAIQFAALAIAGAIGAAVGLGTYFATHDSYSVGGALGYAAGGAGSAIAGTFGVIAALAGAVAGNAIENAVDDKPLLEGAGWALAGDTLGRGVGKILPYAGIHKIEKLGSWFTTKTGLTYMANEFSETSLGNTIGIAGPSVINSFSGVYKSIVSGFYNLISSQTNQQSTITPQTDNKADCGCYSLSGVGDSRGRGKADSRTVKSYSDGSYSVRGTYSDGRTFTRVVYKE